MPWISWVFNPVIRKMHKAFCIIIIAKVLIFMLMKFNYLKCTFEEHILFQKAIGRSIRLVQSGK